MLGIRRCFSDADQVGAARRAQETRLFSPHRLALASELSHDRGERLWIHPTFDQRDQNRELFAINAAIEQLRDVVRVIERFSSGVRHFAADARARAV